MRARYKHRGILGMMPIPRAPVFFLPNNQTIPGFGRTIIG
jgi:hypothetical protein